MNQSDVMVSDTQVAKGYKLDKPKRCPQTVYKLMRHCWKMVRVDSVEECLSNITEHHFWYTRSECGYNYVPIVLKYSQGIIIWSYNYIYLILLSHVMEVKCSCLLALLYKVPSFENSCVVCMRGKVWKVMAH